MELSDVGLTEVGDVELFVLHDMSDRALEILQDEGAVFDDNGDDPDGPSWYCELGDLSPEVVSELESARLGYRARGTAFTGYSGSDAQKHALYQSGLFGWCGYSGRGIVFVPDSPPVEIFPQAEAWLQRPRYCVCA